MEPNEKIYYHSLDTNKVYISPSRTITDVDVTQFLILTGLNNPIFLDKDFAEQHSLGWRVVPAPFLLGVAIGLTDSLIAGTVKAVVEIENACFLKPVKVSDTVRVKTQVKLIENNNDEKKKNLAILMHEVYNQQDILVCTLRRKLKFVHFPFNDKPWKII